MAAKKSSTKSPASSTRSTPKRTIKKKKPKSSKKSKKSKLTSSDSVVSKKASNVQVAVRVRPNLNPKSTKASKVCLGTSKKTKNGQVELYQVQTKTTKLSEQYIVNKSEVTHRFTFDYVYSTQTQQYEIFNDIGTFVLRQAFRGYNVSVFAYGQTGSGKTHTMMGKSSDVAITLAQAEKEEEGEIESEDPHGQEGLIPRLCRALFQHIESRTSSGDGDDESSDDEDADDDQDSSVVGTGDDDDDDAPESSSDDSNITKYSIETSMMEIYNEKVRDLFNPANEDNQKGLKVREHPQLGAYVVGLARTVAHSAEDIQNLLSEGSKMRTIAKTNMNDTSSRSHTIFQIMLTQTRYVKSAKSGNITATEIHSKINLIDLAGSERTAKTGVTSGTDRFKEGTAINLSLTTLGKVINKLAKKSSKSSKKKVFVPYRDSKITWLLKDSLGGNSKTIMIATISMDPSNYSESLSTLKYADNAKKIKNRVRRNQDPKGQLIQQLQKEIAQLKQQLNNQSQSTGPADSFDKNLWDQLSESQRIIQELQMSSEEKEIRSKEIRDARHAALREAGLSVESLSSVFGFDAKKTPHIVNLNEDPSMNECLLYFFKMGDTKIGRKSSDNDIILKGVQMLDQHCIVRCAENTSETHTEFAKPIEDQSQPSTPTSSSRDQFLDDTSEDIQFAKPDAEDDDEDSISTRSEVSEDEESADEEKKPSDEKEQPETEQASQEHQNSKQKEEPQLDKKNDDQNPLSVTLIPFDNALIYVNGVKIDSATPLHSSDRIIFGDHHIFRFTNPTEPAAFKQQSLIDWKYAHEEFAQKQKAEFEKEMEDKFKQLEEQFEEEKRKKQQELDEEIQKLEEKRRQIELENARQQELKEKEEAEQKERQKQEEENTEDKVEEKIEEKVEEKPEVEPTSEKLDSESQPQTPTKSPVEKTGETEEKPSTPSQLDPNDQQNQGYLEKIRGLFVKKKQLEDDKDKDVRQKLEFSILLMVPKIKEANAMAQEMKKDVKYSLKVVLKESTPSVSVQVVNYARNTVTLWTRDEFEDHLPEMKERYSMFQNDPYYDSTGDDPFTDSDIVGSCKLKLFYIIENKSVTKSLPVVNARGEVNGILDVAIQPLNNYNIEDPDDLIGKELDFIVKIHSLHSLKRKFVRDANVRYTFYNDKEKETRRYTGREVKFLFEMKYHVTRVTEDFLSYLEDEVLVLNVHGELFDQFVNVAPPQTPDGRSRSSSIGPTAHHTSAPSTPTGKSDQTNDQLQRENEKLRQQLELMKRGSTPQRPMPPQNQPSAPPLQNFRAFVLLVYGARHLPTGTFASKDVYLKVKFDDQKVKTQVQRIQRQDEVDWGQKLGIKLPRNRRVSGFDVVELKVMGKKLMGNGCIASGLIPLERLFQISRSPNGQNAQWFELRTKKGGAIHLKLGCRFLH